MLHMIMMRNEKLSPEQSNCNMSRGRHECLDHNFGLYSFVKYTPGRGVKFALCTALMVLSIYDRGVLNEPMDS